MSEQNIAFALRQETAAARSLLSNMAGILGDDAEIIASTVEGETNLHEFIGQAVGRVLELDGAMAGIDSMLTSMKSRMARLERQRDGLRELIASAIEATGQKRLELPAATVSLRAVAPKAVITSEADVPSKFFKDQAPKLDKKAVLDALKAKEIVPGAELSNGGMTIAIRAA